jgi:hypothetical protein
MVLPASKSAAGRARAPVRSLRFESIVSLPVILGYLRPFVKSAKGEGERGNGE